MRIPDEVVGAWDWAPGVRFREADSGLINTTLLADNDDGPIAVVQRLNTAIFDPVVHHDIEAVTAHLDAKGLPTPRLVRTRAGDLWATSSTGEVWRRLTWIGDRTVDRLEDPEDARSAGRLVAAFHRATRDFEGTFRSIRGGFHDTGLRVKQLTDALAAHPEHRLYDDVARLADELSIAWARWDGPSDLPERVVHGDLKISNVRFEGHAAIALIDLDTLARGTLDAELGDAFRSWCNRGTEDAVPARFDVGLFAAGIDGYASGAEGVTDAEWASIVPGIERIATELAARFAADALNESYFGWDPARYATRGDANLARARGQASLAAAVRDARSACDAAVKAARA